MADLALDCLAAGVLVLMDPKQPLSPVSTRTYNSGQPFAWRVAGRIFNWRQGAPVNGDV
jgi:hypothetical protein